MKNFLLKISIKNFPQVSCKIFSNILTFGLEPRWTTQLLVNLNLPAIVANSLWLPAACLSLPLEPPHNFPNDKHAKTATALDNGQKEQQDGQQRQQQQQQKQQHINHNAPKRLDRHLRGIVPGPRLSVCVVSLA